MAMKNLLPPGFRFSPTGEELLLFYLARRKMGQLFGPFVTDVDLYEKEPWSLFDYEEQSLFYVFTDLKKTGKRTQRRVGSGTWLGQSNNEVKDGQGNVIGIDRYFNFKAEGGSEHGGWTMHEFALVDERGHPVDDKVVCVIGHGTQISTKQSSSVSVSKKRKRSDEGKHLSTGVGLGEQIDQVQTSKLIPSASGPEPEAFLDMDFDDFDEELWALF